LSSVARGIRSSFEEVFTTVPDIIWLILAMAIIAYFWKPMVGVVNDLKGFLGQSTPSTSTTSTVSTTGTVGFVHSTEPLYGYSQSYTPIQKFFRQMVTERQM
jgi:hypothetical protein